MTDRALNTEEHLIQPMSQKEHETDDLEEHRERVRKIIDEDRDLLDALSL